MIRITVFQDGESMGTGAYDVERVLFGSAEDVDLRIQEPGVLEEHAEVFSSGGKVYVRKLGEAPIWVDGQEVERCELTDEKRLRVGGEVEFAVSFRKAAKTGSVKRGGAISFGSVPTYKEEELEGPSNEPLDLTKTTPEQRKAAEQSKAEALARKAQEQAQEERKNVVKNTLILCGGALLVVGLIWLVIIPTVQKYFFYEDDPIPGSGR